MLHGDVRSGCTLPIRWYPDPRMKLALGTVGLILVATVAGCAASAPVAAAVPVSTTSLTSAPLAPSSALAPSSLAPAAWDGDEHVPAAAPAATSSQSVSLAPTP